MAQDVTICVGTVGTGIWRSPDGGESWAQVRAGLWGESRVYGLTVHPEDPHVLYAGTDDGIYWSADRGQRFERLNSPMNGMHVWKIAVDPVAPQTLFAGFGNLRPKPVALKVIAQAFGNIFLVFDN